MITFKYFKFIPNQTFIKIHFISDAFNGTVKVDGLSINNIIDIILDKIDKISILSNIISSNFIVLYKNIRGVSKLVSRKPISFKNQQQSVKELIT